MNKKSIFCNRQSASKKNDNNRFVSEIHLKSYEDRSSDT